MEGWVYNLIFIFCSLTITHYTYKVAVAIFAANIRPFTLNNYEKLLLGVSMSYWLTFLIS